MVKKIFLAFIAATLLVVPSAGAEGIYRLVASGTVASASIAVTLTNGSADVDLSSATVPRNYKGNLLKIWDVNNVMIQGFVYTDGAGTVQNIVSAKGGATRNWSSQGVGFDDTTNCRYEIWKVNNAVVVASGTVAAGNGKVDLTTNAFAEFGVDLTAPGYQDGKHILALYNTTGGYAAIGWISGTAPGGETLGADVLAGWNFTSEWSLYRAGTSIIDANSFSTTEVGGIYKADVLNYGSLYKASYDISSTTTASVHLCQIGGALNPIANGGYRVPLDIGFLNDVYLRNAGAGTTDVTTITIQQVTDCATTGALILGSDKLTRTWIYKHASFNPNAEFTYKVLYVGD